MSAGVKIAGGIFVSLLTLAIGSVAVWTVTSINEMKNTLARMDERQIILAPIEEKRFASLETDVAELKRGQRNGSNGKN